MPVPKPKKSEKEKDFISRCIRELKRTDPDRPLKQIIAICYAQLRRTRKEGAMKDYIDDAYINCPKGHPGGRGRGSANFPGGKNAWTRYFKWAIKHDSTKGLLNFHRYLVMIYTKKTGKSLAASAIVAKEGKNPDDFAEIIPVSKAPQWVKDIERKLPPENKNPYSITDLLTIDGWVIAELRRRFKAAGHKFNGKSIREMISAKAAKEPCNHYFELSLPLSENTEVPEWIHVLPFGSYKHPKGLLRITESEAQKVVQNFKDDPRDLVLDYEHQSLNTIANGQPAPAAGWIKELELREDGVWAKVEWTERAKEHIKNKEYKYVSPVYVPDYKDPKTGESVGPKLVSVALTNTPFLPDLKPIVNKFQTQEVYQMEKLISLAEKLDIELTDELRENADKLEEAITAKIDELKATAIDKGTEEPSEDDTEKPTEQEPQENEVAMKAIAELQKELAEAKKQLAMRDATEKVERLIAEKRLLPSLKEWAIQYAMKDPQGFDEYAKNLPVIEGPPDVGKDTVLKPATEHSLVMTIASSFGLTKEDIEKYGPKEETINL